MDFLTLVPTVLGMLKNDPISAVLMLVSVGLTAGWHQTAKGAREDRKSAQTAISKAQDQLAELNTNYAASNQASAQIINQIASTLETVAQTLAKTR
jgi:hypothetical protein